MMNISRLMIAALTPDLRQSAFAAPPESSQTSRLVRVPMNEQRGGADGIRSGERFVARLDRDESGYLSEDEAPAGQRARP